MSNVFRIQEPFMPRLFGKFGVWMVYGYDGNAQVYSIHMNAEKAARAATVEGYGIIAFWPIDMSLKEAIAWWTDEGLEAKWKADNEKLYEETLKAFGRYSNHSEPHIHIDYDGPMGKGYLGGHGRDNL